VGHSTNTPTDSIYLAPLGGSADDGPQINAAILDASNSNRKLVLLPGTWQIESTSTAQSNVTVECLPGCTFNINLDWSEQFIKWAPTDAASTTCNGAVAVGDSTITLTSATGFAVGGHVYFPSDNGRWSAEITAVSGNDITVDRPAWFAMADATTAKAFTPLQNFHLIGNGAKFTGAFTGDFEDSRVIWLITTWDCSVRGFRSYLDTADPTAVYGFDMGGRGNLLADCHATGNGTVNWQAVGFEGQEGGEVRNCTSDNCWAGLWLNLCHGVKASFQARKVTRGVVLTPVATATDPTVPGCRECEIDAVVTDIASSGSGVILDTNCDFNRFNLAIDGRTLGSQIAINLVGSASTTGGASNNLFTGSVRNCGLVAKTGNGATDNQIDGLVVTNSGTLSYLSGTGDTLGFSDVRGDLTIANTNIIYTDYDGHTTVRNFDLAVAQTTNCTLGSLHGSSRVTLSNGTITKTGTGTAYGFLTYGTNGSYPVVELENVDLGDWTTAFHSGIPTAAIWERGRVRYTGTVSNTPSQSRQTITLNGATAVKGIMIGLEASDDCKLTRTSTGGTPGAPPLWAGTVKDNAATVPALASWTDSNLTDFPNTIIQEDSATSTHYISATASGAYADGPAHMVVRAKAGTRDWMCFQPGTIHAAYYDLTNGAVGNKLGSGTDAWMIDDGAGGYYCHLFVPRMDSSTMAIYLASANGTISYAGNGTGDIEVLSVTLQMLSYVSVTGVAGDTSNYQLAVE
jgi:hypothetical protein